MNINRVIVTTAILHLLLLLPQVKGKESYESNEEVNNTAPALGFYQRAFSQAPHKQGSNKQPRNVILCIGDGMGHGQVALTRLHAVGPNGRLHMERLPVHGLVSVHSADSLVTDSAAAATALACGIKTKNKVVGQDTNGHAYLTITEAAQLRGLKTGLVASSSITHATPACFAAHVASRKQEVDIAAQLVESDINVLFGGGRQFFLPQSEPDGKREDGRNLIAEAQAAGYHYVSTPEELWTTLGPKVLGLFQAEALETELPEPTLAELTRKALNLLSDKTSTKGKHKGFFLMVEGSQIDWACHKNHAKNTIRQTLLFDETVRAATDYALQDRHTLLIVTADHETGGLVIDTDKSGWIPQVNWTSKNHSALPVPLYAIGPGAEQFAGTLDNTDIPKRIAALLKIKDFPRIKKHAKTKPKAKATIPTP